VSATCQAGSFAWSSSTTQPCVAGQCVCITCVDVTPQNGARTCIVSDPYTSYVQHAGSNRALLAALPTRHKPSSTVLDYSVAYFA
jgi:hypothetical protein